MLFFPSPPFCVALGYCVWVVAGDAKVGADDSLAVGAAALSFGATLSLVPSSSPRALLFEWRAAPDPPATPPVAGPPRTSFWERRARSEGGDAPAGDGDGRTGSAAVGGEAGAAGASAKGATAGAAAFGAGSSSNPSPGALPEALAAALAADSYYESLGIGASEQFALDDSKVRRAYLKTSVLVHPDKHPNFAKAATEAFQRVSEAYAGLKDSVRLGHRRARAQAACCMRDARQCTTPGWPIRDPDQKGYTTHTPVLATLFRSFVLSRFCVCCPGSAPGLRSRVARRLRRGRPPGLSCSQQQRQQRQQRRRRRKRRRKRQQPRRRQGRAARSRRVVPRSSRLLRRRLRRRGGAP
jgi:curved DNA-binding protein CbpA